MTGNAVLEYHRYPPSQESGRVRSQEGEFEFAATIDPLGDARIVTSGPNAGLVLSIELLAVARSFSRVDEVADTSFLWIDGRACFRVVLAHLVDAPTRPQRRTTPAVGILARAVDAPYSLTKAELLVLSHMLLEPSNTAIATALGISVRTVHSHISSILRKLSCESRVQAAVLAIRELLLLPTPATIAGLSGWGSAPV